MKALFIGGTGTISTAVVRRLTEELGWEVWLLNRGNRTAPAGVHQIIADINNEEDVARKLDGLSFDTVCEFIGFHLADVERDYRLFKGKTRQYIYTSSASAYNKPAASYIITEGTSLANPYWQYSRDKIACEAFLMDKYREEGFPVTIVRPSHTYDERHVPLGVHGKNGFWQVVQRIREGKPISGVPGDDVCPNRVRQGPVEHGVDAPDCVGGKLVPILRVLMHPALLPQLRVHPLDVRCGNGSHLLTTQTGLDVLFGIHPIAIHRALPQARGGVVIQPAIQPLSQCHAAVLTQFHISEYLDILVELSQQYLLRRREDVLEDGFAVFLVAHHDAAFPAAILSLDIPTQSRTQKWSVDIAFPYKTQPNPSQGSCA